MTQTFTAVVKNDGEWWIGCVEEVPGVNCQERSRDKLLKTLRVTLMEAPPVSQVVRLHGYTQTSIAQS